ncbi:MAG: hypothetical protein J0M17_01775 [Planctomycetes bacterium]|nr:hypothetical protein [Planctomycetota bacterium]
MTPRLSLKLCVAFVAVVVTAASLRAQAPLEPPVDHPLRYRRVFAPVEQFQAWPFQNELYLPVPGQEFESLVKRAEAAAADAGLPDDSEVRACRYTARFDETQLVGTGEIDFQRRGGEARLVRLSPFALAAYDAVWKQNGEPAKWGMAGGGMMLMVDRDDTLRFAWKQKVDRESAEAAALYLDFPLVPVAQLTLELPEAYDVQRGDYVVERGAKTTGGRYTWTLRAAGGRWRVRFARRDAVQDVRRNGVRIDSSYDFTERGVELTAQLRIDAVHAPLETVTLDLDQGLTLVDARLPDRRITWFAGDVPRAAAPSNGTAKPANVKPANTTPAGKAPQNGKPGGAAAKPAAAATAAPAPGVRRYVLEFERPLVGTSRTLFIKAVAPLVVDRRHRLPTLRVVDLFWNQATLTLAVPAPLEIVRLDPRDCLFTNPVPLAGNRPGEALEVQCFAPNSSVDLTLARRNRPIDAATMTVWRIRDEEASAEFRGEFRIEVGSRFTLEADVPEKWIIDGLTSSPTTALADWSISDAAGGRRLLTVRLAQPLAAERPLGLSITGRLKHHNIGDRLTRDELRFVDFRGAVDPRPMQAFTAEDGLRLFPHETGEPVAAAIERLDPVRRQLLGAAEPEVLLSSADYWELDVRRRQVQLEATIRATARVDRTPATGADTKTPPPPSLEESYQFQFTGTAGAPVEQVRVRFSPAKPGPIDWTLGLKRSGQISAVRLPAAPGATAPADEVWEVTFRRPVVGLVTLDAKRTSTLGDRTAVSLASLVDAAEQAGTLQVSAPAAFPLRITNRSLTPVPSAANDAGAASEVRGEFRYQPGAAAPDVAALELSPLVAGQASPAIVWLLRYDSKYDAARRFEHRATLYMQSFGQGRCCIVVDEPATITALRVNGVSRAEYAGREANLTLDEEAQLLRVEVDFVTSDDASGRLRMLELPVVRVDVPLLLAVRNVALPATFDVPADAGLRSPRRDTDVFGLRRLFGPLVPAAPTANPLSPQASLIATEEARFRLPTQARDVAETSAVHTRIGAAYRSLAAVAEIDEATAPSWAQLFDAVQRQSPAGSAVLRFDVVPLAIAGITADAHVAAPPATAEGDRSLGEQLLNAAGVVLAVGPQGIVVTARAIVQTGDQDALRVFSPGALADGQASGERLLSLADWRSEAGGAWSRLPATSSPHAEEPLGQDYTLALAGDAWGLWIVRREIPPLLALAFVAAGFIIARKLYVSRRLLLPPVAALFAASAALLPDWIGMASASLLLGVAAGVVVCVVLPPRYRPRSRTLGVAAPDRSGKSASSRGASSQTTAATATVVAFCLAMPSHAAAQAQAADRAEAAQTPAAMVFIPVDAAGKPTGDRYQVPQRLLEDLNARAAGEALLRPPYLVRNARYVAQVARDLEQSRYLVTEIGATFELLVLRAPATITLPLGTGAAADGNTPAMIPAFLDGRAVELAVAPGGQAVSFEALDAGPVRLEVTLRPPPPAAATSTFSLTAPRVADAELRVVAPPEIADLSFAGAVEPLRRSEDRRETSARLAMSDKVTFSWATQQSASQSSSIDQLTWLRVRPGSIVLDLRLAVRPPAGGLKELLLAADPRLQWLPKRSQDSVVADVEQTPITSDQAVVGQRVRLLFSRPLVKEETVEVSFLFTGGSGTGNMRLPELRLADETPGRRLFAYSVDPLLDSQLVTAAGLKAVAIPEFLKVWGASTLLPQAAFEFAGGLNSWTLSVRPKSPTVAVRETQTITCGLRRLQVSVESEISVSAGLVYHHELQTPPGMTIDSVDVAELGDDSGGRVGRWSRDEQGKLLVFLRAPIGETHRLTLRGTVPLPQPIVDQKPPAATTATPSGAVPPPVPRSVALPLVTTLGGKLDQRLVRIARAPDVLVAADQLVDLKPAEDETKDVGPTAARLVQTLQVTGAKPAALLQVSTNPRQASAQLTATYIPEDKAWQYELQVAVDVQAGLLDELTLELPPQIATPLALNPSMPYEVVPATATTPRRLILRPRQALSGKFEFLLQAGLTEVRRDEPLPTARLLGLQPATHFLRLPRHLGLSPVRWETSQLAPVRNGRVAARGPAVQEWDAYRVVGAEPQVIMRSARGSGRPLVRFTEHRLLPGLDGSTVGLSSFLIEPAGTASAVLKLPDGARVLAAAAAGAVVNPQVAAGAATVPFASDQMPHFIDVLYERLPDEALSRASVAQLPAWEGLRCERSVIAVYSELSGARHLPTIGVVSRLQGNRRRLAALDAALAELAGDGSRAAEEWSRPLQSRRQDVIRALRIDAEADPQAEEARAVLETLSGAPVTEAVGTPPTATAADRTAADLEYLWNSGPGEACDVAYAIAGEDVREIALRETPRGGDPRRRNIYLPLLCALFAVVCLALVRIDGFLRWPQLAAVVVGTAWLLLLRPTFVGWIILAIVVACRLHPSLRHVRERMLNVSPKLSALRKT